MIHKWKLSRQARSWIVALCVMAGCVCVAGRGYAETTSDDNATPPVVENSGDVKADAPAAAVETVPDSMEDKVARKVIDQLKDKLKKEIREEMRQDDKNWLDRMHLSVPEWTKRIRLYGDFKLREEGIFYDKNNYDTVPSIKDGVTLTDTTQNQNRFRYRARVGLNAEINNQAQFEVRFSSGTTSNPDSLYSTMGDYFNKDSVVIDLAYLKLFPLSSTPTFSVFMGRFSSPFVGTSLVWNDNLGFEGISLSLDERKTRTFGPILTAGAFPIQVADFASDKWLYGCQAGFEYRPSSDFSWVFTTAYYHYSNIQGVSNTTDYPDANTWTSPLYQQKGNTLINLSADPKKWIPGLASNFHLVDATTYVDCAWYYPVHVRFTADVVHNIGFDKEDIIQRAGVTDLHADTTGMKVEFMVGHADVRSFGEWQWLVAYRYIGADAVLDAFNDQDFHQGGTNAKGWNMKGSFGLMKNIWLDAQWFSANEIRGPQLNIDQFQLDLNVKF